MPVWATRGLVRKRKIRGDLSESIETGQQEQEEGCIHESRLAQVGRSRRKMKAA